MLFCEPNWKVPSCHTIPPDPQQHAMGKGTGPTFLPTRKKVKVHPGGSASKEEEEEEEDAGEVRLASRTALASADSSTRQSAAPPSPTPPLTPPLPRRRRCQSAPPRCRGRIVRR